METQELLTRAEFSDEATPRLSADDLAVRQQQARRADHDAHWWKEPNTILQPRGISVEARHARPYVRYTPRRP